MPLTCDAEEDASPTLSIVNPHQWKEELHLCYSKVPKVTFPCWYVPDTLDQMQVKKAAGTAAYQYLIDLFNKTNKGDVGEGFKERRLKYLCNCFRTFHAITVQLLCNHFHLEYIRHVYQPRVI